MDVRGSFQRIVIIANPVSRRNGAKIGNILHHKLSTLMPEMPIDVLLTQSKTHAKQLAKFEALLPRNPLIISAGGDGMYNEVINGVLLAGHQGRHQPITAVYKAGNANDHYHSLHHWSKKAFLRKVLEGQTQKIDLLKLTVQEKNESQVIYAHSYIGIGFSADGAKALNQLRPKNRLHETVVVINALKKLRPVDIITESGKQESFVSLSFHNSRRMAKYFTVDSNGTFDDGLFEYVAVDSGKHPYINLASYAFRAITKMLIEQPQADHYRFSLPEQCYIQFDGEEMLLPAECDIEISIRKQALTTLA
jgi:diacylglycerol kinase family enzyme